MRPTVAPIPRCSPVKLLRRVDGSVADLGHTSVRRHWSAGSHGNGSGSSVSGIESIRVRMSVAGMSSIRCDQVIDLYVFFY